METTFFHDTKFIYDGKDYYTRGPLNQEKFNEYSKYFGNITVVSRQEDSKGKNKVFTIEKNIIKGINFIPVNSNYKGMIKKVKEQVKSTEFAIVRLPSFIGITALHYLKKYNKKYMIEMVGCPFDALWNYGNIQGKIIAPIMYILNRYYIKNAENVLYVSNEFLQKRYPNKKNSIGCSDVNIDTISEEILEKRIEKIENKKKNDIIKIGLIGSLNVKYKGHEIAIKAISKLKDKYKIELHFLGAGDKENWLNIIKKYGVSNNIYFDGTLPSGQEVYNWMDKLDIYIIPSLQEGMPRALIEAMSRACPCIGSNVGGIPELIEDECIIPKKNEKELEYKIIELIEDKDKMKSIAKRNFYKSQEYEKNRLEEKRNKFRKEVLDKGKNKQEEKKIDRVIHVVKIMNHGGAETMIMNLYRNIDRNKIQFDFLCMEDKIGEYDKEIKELGGKIYRVPSPEKGRLNNLKTIYKTLKNIGNYRAIHSHISYYSGYVNLVAFLANIKLRIVHSHTTNDLRKQTFIRRLYNNFSKILIKLFSNVKIACGEKAGKYLYGNSKFIIIKNGIDLEKYFSVSKQEINELKIELGINSEDFVIGHVGRFEEVKNQQYFIKLAKALKKKNINFKIVLVGNGSKLEEIREKIKQENLEKYFSIPGVREDIQIFMNMFDIFVLPSLYEGFPLVVVEALAGQNKCYLSDTISKETNVISGMVDFFSLNDTIDILVQKILTEHKKKDKIEIEKELIDKGFSIKKSAKNLMEIYLK